MVPNLPVKVNADGGPGRAVSDGEGCDLSLIHICDVPNPMPNEAEEDCDPCGKAQGGCEQQQHPGHAQMEPGELA